MTNHEVIHVASVRLYTHFVKLYFPEELENPNPENPTVETQKEAHVNLILFLKSGGLIQDRFRSFLHACDKLETDYLCLDKPIPSMKEEIRFLFSEAETAFKSINRHNKAAD